MADQAALPSIPTLLSHTRALFRGRVVSTLIYILLAAIVATALGISGLFVYRASWGAEIFIALFVIYVCVLLRFFAALLTDFASPMPLGAWGALRASKGKRALRVVGATAAYFCVVLGGLVLFLVPGIVAAVVFIAAPFFIASGEELSITAAFWKSYSSVRLAWRGVFIRLAFGVLALVLFAQASHTAGILVPHYEHNAIGVWFLLSLQPFLNLCIALLSVVYVATLSMHVKMAAAAQPLAVQQGGKGLLYTMGAIGAISFLVLPVLLAAYNIGQNSLLLREYAALGLQLPDRDTRVFASHRFGVMFSYPASWSDGTLAETASTDGHTVIYLVHNDLGGYTKKFILRKFLTKQSVAQFAAGYEAEVTKKGDVITNKSTAGGVYSAVVIETVPAQGSMPAVREAHDIIVFPGSMFRSNGMYTVDFYDKADVYLRDFASVFDTISSTMTGIVPADVPDTHEGR